MTWVPGDCLPGDLIRVRLGGVYHVGIFAGEDEVIQFGLPPVPEYKDRPAVVCVTDVDFFACGGIVERAELTRQEKKRAFPPAQIIARARARMGEGGYDVLHNNCEHFANECVFGEKRSEQTEQVRQRWLNRPLLRVYLAPLPEEDDPAPLFPPQREKEVLRCRSAEKRKQKRAAWRLLAFALRHTYGQEMSDLSFRRQMSGKWICDRCWFSLSHTASAVAVVLSDRPVGVDLEEPAPFAERYRDDPEELAALEVRALTDRERMTPCDDPARRFLELWTKKESAYKRDGHGFFRPGSVETADLPCVTLFPDVPCPLILSVCAQDPEQAQVFYTADGETCRRLGSEQNEGNAEN